MSKDFSMFDLRKHDLDVELVSIAANNLVEGEHPIIES